MESNFIIFSAAVLVVLVIFITAIIVVLLLDNKKHTVRRVFLLFKDGKPVGVTKYEYEALKWEDSAGQYFIEFTTYEEDDDKFVEDYKKINDSFNNDMGEIEE